MRKSQWAHAAPLAALLVLGLGCDGFGPALEGSFDRTLNVAAGVDLEVVTGSGDIRIRSGPESTVRVHASIRARASLSATAEEKLKYLAEKPPVEQIGNVVRIGRIDDERYRNNVSISYELEVPAGTRVRSKTGSGNVSIEGLRGDVEATTGSGDVGLVRISGDVLSKTGSGNIELASIQGKIEASTGSGDIRATAVAGPFSGKSGSGDVTLESTGPGDVDLSTGSGNLEATGIRGDLRAHTGSGRITAGGTPAGTWKLRASSGDVRVRLSGAPSFDLDARADSGTIRVDHAVSVSGAMSPREMRGKVRGGGPIVEIRTGSGDILVQ